MRRLSEEAGLVYNPHPERVPNSRRALELGEWARARGAHGALHERVMDAYWTEGRDIGGWDVLGPCVADIGLDPREAEAEVESGAFRAAVDSSSEVARRHGINAVPAFVVRRPGAGERRAAARGAGARGGPGPGHPGGRGGLTGRPARIRRAPSHPCVDCVRGPGQDETRPCHERP